MSTQPPYNLAISSISDSAAVLTWEGNTMFGFNIYRSKYAGDNNWNPYVKLNGDLYYSRPATFTDNGVRTIEVIASQVATYIVVVNGVTVSFENTHSAWTYNDVARHLAEAIKAASPSVNYSVASTPSGVITFTSDSEMTITTEDTKLRAGAIVGPTPVKGKRYMWRVTQVISGIESVMSNGVTAIFKGAIQYPYSTESILIALKEWASTIVGTSARVIRSKQEGPRPAKPYIVLDLGGPETVGQDDERRRVDGNDSLVGTRRMVASCDVWGIYANDIVGALLCGLNPCEALEPLRLLGVSPGVVLQATDLSQKYEAGWEHRVRLEFELLVPSYFEGGRGTIERVALGIKLGDNLDATVDVQKPTA